MKRAYPTEPLAEGVAAREARVREGRQKVIKMCQLWAHSLADSLGLIYWGSARDRWLPHQFTRHHML